MKSASDWVSLLDSRLSVIWQLVASAILIPYGSMWQPMPSPEKVPVPYERVMVKMPMGLHKELAELLTREQRWPSRQDFIIDAVREKLDRLGTVNAGRENRTGDPTF